MFKRIIQRILSFFKKKEPETLLDVMLPLMISGTRDERKAKARELNIPWNDYRGLEYQASHMIAGEFKQEESCKEL